MMLVQERKGTFTEVGAVIIVRLKSANSWDESTLFSGNIVELGFQLLEFSCGIMLKLM